MNSRERFLAACACQTLERPPLWVMRQAGRYLPEYRALKAKYSFLEMVRTPALAPAHAVLEKLSYVAEALALLKTELAGKHALLGFGGSPWTLATYMVEGGSSDDFERIKTLFYTDRATFDALLEKLTAAIIVYFQMQIRAGADAIQIFDSWGGLIAGADYEAASLKWIRQIIAALPQDFPVILYAKGTGSQLTDQAFSGARVLSVDWTCDLAVVRRTLPANVAVQGNLDPILLNTTPEIVRREATRLLESMRGTAGHIFNLGHGITPQAKIECMEALVKTVTGWRN